MTKDQIVEQLKSNAVSILTKFVMAKAVAFSSVFAAPIIGPLASLIVGKVLAAAVQHGEFFAFDLHADHFTDDQAEEFVDAIRRKDRAQSKEELEKAEAELWARHRDLIKLRR